MHLLSREDQLACLYGVDEHLLPQGRLIIGVITPGPEKLARTPSDEFIVRREFDMPNGYHVLRKVRLDQHDPVDQVRLFEFKFEEFEVAGRPVRERVVPLRTRYLFHDELQLLLETVGFQVLEVYRDYEENCYDGTGEMIMVARRPSLTGYNLPKENPRTGCIERK